MGMFSWDCKGCGHSVREGKSWMGKAVATDKEGSRLIGAYDGYGRIVEAEVMGLCGAPEVWHFRCWTLAGKPEWTGGSRNALDQGMPNGDLPEPGDTTDVARMAKSASALLAAKRAAMRDSAW